MTIQITDVELKELVKNACEQAVKQVLYAYITKTGHKFEKNIHCEIGNGWENQ